MSNIEVEVSATIDAAPARVYEVLADYRNHHPHILPKPYFVDLQVVEGGIGAGTQFITNMDVYGNKRTLRMVVSEPQPGRVLAETDPAQGMHTTFTVEPLAGGAKSKVTIATSSQVSRGLAGWVERLVNPAITRRIYREELKQLNAYLQKSE